MFDFPPARSKAALETLQTLAGLSRFVIADLADARAVVQELQAIVSSHPSLPIQPLLDGREEIAGLGVADNFFVLYPSFLRVYHYESTEELLENLTEIIEPAETRSREVERRLASYREKMESRAVKQATRKAVRKRSTVPRHGESGAVTPPKKAAERSKPRRSKPARSRATKRPGRRQSLAKRL